MAQVRVEIWSRDPNIADEWDALIARARTNAFMDPLALRAVFATRFARTHLLLAWSDETRRELVGVWALREQRSAPLLPPFLAAPPYEYAFLSNPVVDPAHIDGAIEAMLAAIENTGSLPKVLRLRYLDAECESYRAIRKALAARGSRTRELAVRERPFATKEAAQKRSGSTRKKLRQDWNRLSALGSLETVNDKTPDAVPAAFEKFLALEAASWKGERGTALLSDERDAAFVRRFIGNLAVQGHASVALLELDGAAVAAQVVLYSADTAYTWKTAFDTAYAKYSPGALLVDKVTDQLFASGVAAIDSCSPEGSFMEKLWTGRRATVDLLADVRAKPGLGFVVSSLHERGYRELRSLRDRLRQAAALISAFILRARAAGARSRA